MFARVIALALTLLLGGWPAAARIATPDPASLPEATAPFGLAGVALPDSREAVEALLAGLPAAVDGEFQQPSIAAADRFQVPFGDPDVLGYPMVIGAVAFAESDFFPHDFTAGDYVAMQLGSGERQLVDGGRDGDLAWLRAEIVAGAGGGKPGTPETQRTLHTLTWGAIDGGWMFTAVADTPARLEALVTAFVAAAAGRATPAATPAG
jgi:hypothetical protein